MATLQMNILSLKLGMQANFSAILPSCTADDKRSFEEIYKKGEKFKTLWLLGSEYGDDSEALKYTSILRYAEKNNMAVIMPCTYNRLYSNDKRGQKFLDFITDELWNVCMGTFSLSDKREDNFIGGFSLGAYGALKATLHNPSKYGKVIMIGGAFEENLKDGYLHDLNRKIEEDGFVPQLPLDDAEENDSELYPFAKEIIGNGGEAPEILVTYAKSSPFANYAAAAAENLGKMKFKVRAGAYDCADTWEFRDNALKDAIDYCFAKTKEAK